MLNVCFQKVSHKDKKEERGRVTLNFTDKFERLLEIRKYLEKKTVIF